MTAHDGDDPTANLHTFSDGLAVALTSAIQNGDVTSLKALLEEEPTRASMRIVDAHDVQRTLLHVATDWPGHFPNGRQIVELLVAEGAEVDAPLLPRKEDGTAETALHWAASSDDVEVLEALLDAGANIEAPGAVITAGTPMSDAVIFAKWRAAQVLLERGASTTVWQAAALGLLDQVRAWLLAMPAPGRDEVTNTFWHACHGGQLKVAQLLAEHGAEVDWIGHGGKTPLDVARLNGGAPLVQWLVDLGARGGLS